MTVKDSDSDDSSRDSEENGGSSPGESSLRMSLENSRANRRLKQKRAISFQVSCEVNKHKMSRQKYLQLKSEERKAQSKAARKQIALKSENP